MKQQDLTGWDLATEGMEAAAANADRHSPNWTGRAYVLLQQYIATLEPGTPITSESARAFAHGKHGLIEPPDNRAWGTIMVMAHARGKLDRTERFVPALDPKVHVNPIRVWLVPGGPPSTEFTTLLREAALALREIAGHDELVARINAALQAPA